MFVYLHTFVSSSQAVDAETHQGYVCSTSADHHQCRGRGSRAVRMICLFKQEKHWEGEDELLVVVSCQMTWTHDHSQSNSDGITNIFILYL